VMAKPLVIHDSSDLAGVLGGDRVYFGPRSGLIDHGLASIFSAHCAEVRKVVVLSDTVL